MRCWPPTLKSTQMKASVRDLDEEISAAQLPAGKPAAQAAQGRIPGGERQGPGSARAAAQPVDPAGRLPAPGRETEPRDAQMRNYTAIFTTPMVRSVKSSWLTSSMSTSRTAWESSRRACFYLVKLKELILGEPRESNTEGGLFPAIFGTIMLIFIMSLFSFPLGVIAAVYLREYAKEGMIVRLVRIAVNNLAGIPSIVYGIFGLGLLRLRRRQHHRPDLLPRDACRPRPSAPAASSGPA